MYKDLAKWLAALVPVTTIVTLGVGLAVNLPEGGYGGAADVVGANLGALLAIAATVLGLGVLIAACTYVLLARSATWAVLRDQTDWLSGAFSDHGVGEPYFLESTQFESARSGAAGTTDGGRDAVAKSIERLLALSEAQESERRFKRFKWAYGISIVVIVVGIVATMVLLDPQSSPVVQPTAVVLHVVSTDEASFTKATACKVLPTEAVVVAGTWAEPALRFYGEGCTESVWEPPDDIDLVVTPK